MQFCMNACLCEPTENHPQPQQSVNTYPHFLPAEIYRTLPVREDLLKAVLGADLIGE